MRPIGFLRTPIRADQQGRMQNLNLSEEIFAGDPDPRNPFPQSLKISFQASEDEVEIAALWEGVLRFFPDSTAGYPNDPAEVTLADFPAWPPLVGDLVLVSTDFSLAEPFQSEISLIKSPPSVVRYSKVRLTQRFLFETLREVRLPVNIIEGRAIVRLDDTEPLWHQKYLLAFLNGTASVWCPLDPNDAANDFTNKAMPSVAIEPAGTTTLTVTASSRVDEVIDASWFDRKGKSDDVSGEVLVPGPSAFTDQLYNPKHPGHSVIPLSAILLSATDLAFEGDHFNSPLMVSVASLLPAGTVYRRIDIVRPPRPGNTVSSYPIRPFPQYKLNWIRDDDLATLTSLRIPLEGHIYIPFADGNFTFWVTPRSHIVVDRDGIQCKLSMMLSQLPLPNVPSVVTANEINLEGFAYLPAYDSKRIWEAFKALSNFEIVSYQAKTEAIWNVEVLNWYIYRVASMADYAAIYGYIVASAGRHGLAPEFLHAVFMGEAVNWLIDDLRENHIMYSETLNISCYERLGLDLVVYRLGLNSNPPPLPDPEYTYNLVDEGYLDNSFRSSIVNIHSITRNEAGGPIQLEVADIQGWEAAIEIVAAELHARLDEMMTYCGNSGISITKEIQRRYLAYVRFNTSRSNAEALVDNLDESSAYLKRWTGPPPLDNQRDARYNTLQRIAVAEWYEAAGVYR